MHAIDNSAVGITIAPIVLGHRLALISIHNPIMPSLPVMSSISLYQRHVCRSFQLRLVTVVMARSDRGNEIDRKTQDVKGVE